MFRNILIAIDGSKHAERALEEAVDLARQSNASLTALTAVPALAPWVFAGGYGALVPPISLEDVQEQGWHEHERMLDGMVRRVAPDSRCGRSSSRGHRRRQSSPRRKWADTISS